MTPNTGYTVRGDAGRLGWCIPDPLPHDGSSYSPFTIEHWLYMNANNEDAGLLSVFPPGSSWDDTGINLYIRSQGAAGYAFTVSGSHVRTGSPPLALWAHVAWVWTGSQVEIWEDGVLLGSTGISSIPVTGDYWHADYNGGNEPINGQVARLRFWSKALDSAGITAAREASHDPDDPDLLMDYPLDTEGALHRGRKPGHYALLLNYKPAAADYLIARRADLVWPSEGFHVMRKFGAHQIGTLPAEWAPFGRDGLLAEVVPVDDLPLHDAAIEVTSAPGSSCYLAFLPLPEVEHADVLVLQRMSPANDGIAFVGPVVRGNTGDETTLTCTQAHARENRRHQISRYTDGEYSQGEADDSPAGFDFREWHWMRAQFAPDGEVRLRFWYEGWDEPAEWHFSATQSQNPAGYAGWFCSHVVGHQLAHFEVRSFQDTYIHRDGPHLAGTVKGIDGEPAPGRHVIIFRRMDGAQVGRVPTDANGQWQWVAPDPDAEYFVTAIDPADSAQDYAPPAANRLIPVQGD